MDQQSLQQLKVSLQKEAAELRKQLTQVATKDPAVKGGYQAKVEDLGHDEYDTAIEDADLDRNFALEEELKRKLLQIETAIQKIDNGTYGACSHCNNPIEEKRLEAIPFVSLCISCAHKT